MKIYAVIILFSVFSCKENKPKDETLDLKYEVLNQLISAELKNDSLMGANEKFISNYVYNISLKKIYLQSNRNKDEPPPPPNFGIDLEYDSIFLQKDSAYYTQQQKVQSDFKFNKNKIKKKLDYTNDEELYKISQTKSSNFWTEFNRMHNNKCVRTLSVPFFNKSKTECIVQSSISCGPLDGGGNTAIYRKIKGKWIRIRTFDIWVS